MNNEMIKQLLEMDTINDFRFSNLTQNAMECCLNTRVDKEEDILDCSELFSIENVVNNRHGKMFVYSHKHTNENMHIDIIRTRRKVDIALKYIINSQSTIDELLLFINKYIGDNKSIVLYASIDKGIEIAFIKEYKNVNNVVINTELCLLRVSLCVATNANVTYTESIRVIASKIYHSFLSSDFINNANIYMDELKSKYLANFSHIYLDTLDNFFSSNAEKFNGIKNEMLYNINKELAICDFITEQTLKFEHFKNNWNNFIGVSEYNKMLGFALDYTYVKDGLKSRDSIITACMFLLYNIDKITINLVREAKGNNSIQTDKDIEDMYIKAIDIALITSKDILAAIVDNERLEVKIEPAKALELLKIYNVKADLLSSIKESILNPIINSVIDDVLKFKEEEKLENAKKEMEKENEPLSEN